MIIEYDFAQDLLEDIETELTTYDHEIGINISKGSAPSRSNNFEWIYNSQSYCLPIYSRNSTDIIQLDQYYFEIFFNGIKDKQPKLVAKGIEATIESELKNCVPPSTIYTAISDKVSKLVFQYDKVLETTRENNNLFGIQEEEKILKNHLNKYNELLRSPSKQIEFLRGIVLNKKISDLILMIYIRFVNKRLNMLNPVVMPFNEPTPTAKELPKVIWYGSQKELCELFVELQRKGWMEKIQYGKINKTAKAICNLFDLTLTQKDHHSDLENSFYQILKGKNNPKTKQRAYDEIFGEHYHSKFDKIIQNKSFPRSST